MSTYAEVQRRFASRLEAFREQLGLTKRQFAWRCGITIHNYDYYTNKGGMPNLYTAMMIAERLGLTLDQMIGTRGGKTNGKDRV